MKITEKILIIIRIIRTGVKFGQTKTNFIIFNPCCGFFICISSAPATGYVVDNANILTIQEKAEITSMIVNIQKNTTNEIAVLIIPNLEDETIETYAEKGF